jgi:3-methylcrotonyl-CoA carboxylase alpha subunit
MDEATRAAVCGAAVKAAQAVDYVGAGTIEFIADASEGLRPDRIWFMEMNTRLQVEHPVTEEITGQDLVEWQLRVASGEPLPLSQDELRIDGWAMEARLYAEDPASEFLPSIGKLEFLGQDTDGRFETGVEEGDVISPYYDPMIAKLVVHGSDREAARIKLAAACGSVLCYSVRTNAWFLKRLCDHPSFAAEDISTGFIAQHHDGLTKPPQPSEMLLQEAAESLIFHGWKAAMPWVPRPLNFNLGLAGFRLNAPLDTRVWFYLENRPLVVDYDLSLYDGGTNYEVSTGSMLSGSEAVFFEAGAAFRFTRFADVSQGGGAADGTLLSPMPGRVISVEVAQGDKVAKGQKLLTLEAMKMEHSMVAPFDGVVAELEAAVGAQVTEGTLLVRVEKGE